MCKFCEMLKGGKNSILISGSAIEFKSLIERIVDSEMVGIVILKKDEENVNIFPLAYCPYCGKEIEKE